MGSCEYGGETFAAKYSSVVLCCVCSFVVVVVVVLVLLSIYLPASVL